MFSKLLENFIFGPYAFIIATGLLFYWVVKAKSSDRFVQISLSIFFVHLFLINSLIFEIVSLPLRAWIPENSVVDANAIVVHGSSAHIIGAPTSGSAERGYLGAEAFREGRAPVVLLMGFSPTDSLGSARAMQLIALGRGVPQDRILMSGGRTTYEEAQLGSELLRIRSIRSIVVVTSWYHLPRARAVWQKQGFEVMTHTYLPEQDIWSCIFEFHWGNIWRHQLICHEYAGLFVYWLRGWI